MTAESGQSSRREFVANVGRLASAAALTACATSRAAPVLAGPVSGAAATSGAWDLAWVDRLATATDRAVFDWPSVGDPADPIVLEVAARYLENCAAVYGATHHDARVVLNIRSTAVPAALSDAAWARHSLGMEYGVNDPATRDAAVRNPFWRLPPGAPAAGAPPTLEDLMRRGAIVLVCDFALGHLAKRLATRNGGDPNAVHRDLRDSFIPGAFAVPSGIFGLARAQNAGCAYVRV